MVVVVRWHLSKNWSLPATGGATPVPVELISNSAPSHSTPLLTDEEFAALDTLCKFINQWFDIMRGGNDHDIAEFVSKVHDLQHMIMSQAAARAYPEKFRLLGGSHE